jgi:hypothetical protein
VDPVSGVQLLFDYTALGIIQEAARGRLFLSFLSGHDRFDSIAPRKNIGDVGALSRDGLRRRKAATGGVPRSVHRAEIPTLAPRLEVGTHLGIGGLAHAPAQRVAEDETFIGDGLTLEKTVPRIGEGFFRASRPIWITLLGPGALAGLNYHLSRLVAELGG